MRLRFTAVVLLAMAALAAALFGCGNKEDKGKRAVPVVAAKAERRTVPVTLKAVGSVEAQASVAIKTRVGGMILEQFVQDGQDVKQGDPLFRIDPRPFEAVVRESKAKLERDQVMLKKANDDLRRYAGLIEKSVISRDQFEQTEAAAKSLAATIRLNQAELESKELELSYTLISSPIDGRVGHIQVTQGNVIKANDDRNLAVINQVRPITVVFAVPEQHVTAIMRHMAQGELAVQAFSSADGSFVEAGRLSSLDNAVDKGTGTIKLKALFANEHLLLWPGQFVRVNLELTSREGVVLVPAKAVQAGMKGQYVYVVTAGNTAEMRPVTVGEGVDGQNVIESGLEAGETVVVEGHIKLVPGTPVQVEAAKPAPAATPAAKAPEAPADKPAAQPAAPSGEPRQ